MSHNINNAPDAKAFLERVVALPESPGVSLDSVLTSSIEKEAELRRLYAQDRRHNIIADPFVGLVSVFDAPASIWTSRSRIIKDKEDLSAKYIFPLEKEERREDNTPCMVDNIEEFQKNWSIFTEGSLSQLKNWNNVVAAGGSVLGCLLPLSDKVKESKRNIRKFYHSSAFPTSDVDLFLWGLTAEQAEVKINEIYEAVRDSIPWDVTCVRTKHAISIYSQYPYRSVQIVLRLYQSPAEVLAGFDVDAPCVAYDGCRVLANHRSIVAMMRQANTIDITRRSPSYEIRLAKYASRGFEVFVPDLKRGEIDPTIFERSITRITGLARLLVLEKLANSSARQSYLESRRNIRSRVNNTNMYQARNRRVKRYKNDLKDQDEIAGLEFNDYDLASLHIPYGPGWTAKRIEKLVYQTDLGTNSTFNPRNKERRLHRHPAFFGTMKECMEDLCGYCPEPKTKEERELQEEEDKAYVRGRLTFLEDDPGRQSMTGSFNPIDIGEWSEQAYLGSTEKLFSAIAALDREAFKQLITSDQVDVNRRDHVGRTALQLAVLCRTSEICVDLIEAGARITSRLADGRTALHLASQMDLPIVVEKLLEKSHENDVEAKKAEEAKAAEEAEAKEDKMDEDGDEDNEDEERDSSEDDWSSEGEAAKKKEEDAQQGESAIPEDNTEEPDVLDVNAPDWDFAFTPLFYAILSGAKRVVQALLNAGADPKLPSKANNYQAPVLHPLSVTVLNDDEEKNLDIIEQLIRGGASSSQADSQLFSIFHSIVCSGRTRVLEKILQVDPKANSAINVPSASSGFGYFYFPLVTAISKGHYAIAALLIGYGAKVLIHPDDLQKVKNMIGPRGYSSSSGESVQHPLDYLKEVVLPAEVAIAYHTYMLKLLARLKVQVSVPINYAYSASRYNPDAKMSILDWVNAQIKALKKELETPSTQQQQPTTVTFDAPERVVTFEDFRRSLTAKTRALRDSQTEKLSPQPSDNKDTLRSLAYYEEMKAVLEKCSAKTYKEIYGIQSQDDKLTTPQDVPETDSAAPTPCRTQYNLLKEYHWRTEGVDFHYLDQYDALFEACWRGDNARIEELCLPLKGSTSDKAPIQIAATTAQFTESDTAYGDGIHTPLSVAVQSRKWETARLILAIAAAQYETKTQTTTFFERSRNLGGIDLDEEMASDDSDAEDEDSGGEELEMGANPREIGTFTDLANRTSAVKSTTPPAVLFAVSVSDRPNKEGTRVIGGTILQIACADGDLETFVNICDLMKLLPEPQFPDNGCLHDALESDCPEILDEIIRRTGLGSEFEPEEEDDEDEQGERKTSKLYLGLTVHGRKRKDLANPNANRPSQSELPLLWRAVRLGAKKIIEYLSSTKPLAAYGFYAQSSSDERALALRKYPLETQLPSLLGITPRNSGETPLIAVISSDYADDKKLEIMKHVLANFPAQASAYLHSPDTFRLKFLRMNALMVATAEDLDVRVIEYLLASGVAADGVDKRGFNIYHIICKSGNIGLLGLYLGKLPKDVSSRMLKQASRRRGNTPLMLAVKAGKIGIVEKLLQSNLSAAKEAISIRDKEGSLPVHVAVRSGFAEIASLIITNGGPDTLYSENAVGETPLDTATILWLLHATRNVFQQGVDSIQTLQPSSVNKVPDPNLEKLSSELKLLKYVQTSFEQSGKLATNPEYKKALESFIPYLSGKCEELSEEAAAENSKPKSSTNADQQRKMSETEENDPVKTFKVVSNFAFSSPGKRQLVHLIDVQSSVQDSLEKAGGRLRAHMARFEDEDAPTTNVAKEESSGILNYCKGTQQLSDL